MCCTNTSRSLSRLGILWGMCAMATLLTAFVSNVWVYTKEPVQLPNSELTTSISFRIGLWRICPTVKRINASIHMPSPACSLIKYSGWKEITHTDIGVWTVLEFTPSFVTKMRYSTPFEAASVILVLLATVFAMLGHCNNDNKTLIACGLFILGGLSLGCGLVVFASVLSEEKPIRHHTSSTHPPHLPSPPPPFDYRYGWSFFAAVAAFIMSEVAAFLTMSSYLRRFPTVEDMVRLMVPGAERKLREHQQLSGDWHASHSSMPQCSSKFPCTSSGYRQQYDLQPAGICTVNNRPSKTSDASKTDLEGCDGPLLLNKTTPDICTSNNETSGYSSEKVDSLHVTSSVVIPGLIEQDFTGPFQSSGSPLNQSFVGQTVPIIVNKSTKSNNLPQTPFAYSENFNPRYGTLPHPGGAGTTVHQGFLGVSEIGSSSSNSSSSYCSKSKTLQHPKHSKKSVTIGTFSTMDTSFPTSDKRSNTLGYAGSAV